MPRTFFFLLIAISIASAQDIPPAPHAQIFNLTTNPGYFSEPAVAVNPGNPRQVVGVYQSPNHASYSQDAGHSWQPAESVSPANYRVSGDVSVTFDNQSHAFLCYMAFDKLGTFNYWAHGATRNGIFIRRSLDGGKTWEANPISVSEFPSQPGIPFEDKPYIVADNTKSKYAGNLYIGWTRWRLTDSLIVLSRSTDDGKTWSQPIEIDAHPGLPRDDNGAAEGFDGVVAPDGAVYAIWSQGDDIMFTRSRNGGQSFSRPRSIIHTAPIMFDVNTLERANGFPQIAIDPHGKRLFITWSDYRNGDLDVFLSFSDDKGKHWSTPVRVNNDPVHDGAEQFFQWLAVDPVDASVNVVFYDRRRSTGNKNQIVVLARSTDQGRTFTNYAWTEQPFDSEGSFLGDYSGLSAYGGRVYGIWTEKPVPPSEAAKAGDNKKDDDKKEETKSRRGTVVKLGTADFSSN